MATPTTYEFKQVRCGIGYVQAVVNQHQMFHWEVMGTNTVVSRESHLESGGFLDSDSIYSVTTEERFSTIDFRRPKDLSRLPDIKAAEAEFFSLVNRLERLGFSAIDNYSSPPPKQINWILFIVLCTIYVIPGVLYWRSKSKKYEAVRADGAALKGQLDAVVNNNRELLAA